MLTVKRLESQIILKKVFGNKYTKGHNQDSQNILINYIIIWNCKL